MAREDRAWYSKQATISKIVTWMAILGLVASIGGAVYVAHTGDVVHAAMWVVAGIPVAIIMLGLSAVIDLLIIHGEALRDLRK